MKPLEDQICDFVEKKRKEHILNSQEYKDLYKEENMVISGYYDLFLEFCLAYRTITDWVKFEKHETDESGREYVKIPVKLINMYTSKFIHRDIQAAKNKLAKIHTKEYPLTEEHMQEKMSHYGL